MDYRFAYTPQGDYSTLCVFVSSKNNRRKINDFFGLRFRTSPLPLPGISGGFEASSQGWGQ